MPEPNTDSVVRLSSRVRHRAVGDEGVLVHLERGQVLVVNELGMFIVQQLEQAPTTAGNLADAVAAGFDVEAEQARNDVSAFLDRLLAEGAIVCEGQNTPQDSRT